LIEVKLTFVGVEKRKQYHSKRGRGRIGVQGHLEESIYGYGFYGHPTIGMKEEPLKVPT